MHTYSYIIRSVYPQPPPPPWRVVEGNGYNMKIIKITNDEERGKGVQPDRLDYMIYRYSEVSEADTGNIEAVALYFFTYLLFIHAYV
jgi:hypothetical protein